MPDRYGTTRLVVQVRDPYWLHAYWELAGAEQRRAVGRRAVLRVYELNGPRFAPNAVRRAFDVGLTPEARDWFVEVGRPSAWWCLELGIMGEAGFVPLVRSNLVQTPSDHPSEEMDDAWPRLEEALAAQLASTVHSGQSSSPRRSR